jgi:hypothetical protein
MQLDSLGKSLQRNRPWAVVRSAGLRPGTRGHQLLVITPRCDVVAAITIEDCPAEPGSLVYKSIQRCYFFLDCRSAGK